MAPNNTNNNNKMKQDQEAFALATESFFAPMLLCLGLILFFVCHYTLPFTDLFFCVTYPLYLFLANKFRFDDNSAVPANTPPLSLGKGNFLLQPGFQIYMMVFQVGAVLMPLITLVAFPPPDAVANALVSRLVLLLAQIVTENTSTHWHDVPRILAPIGFNAYGLFSANSRWLQAALEDAEVSWIHVGVAALNGLLWSYNLFVFLLLRVLPVYTADGSPTVPVEWKFFLYPVVVQKDKDKQDKMS